MAKANKTQEKKITRGTRSLIKRAIIDTKSVNRYDLCEYIANDLEDKFKGDTLEYQLKRMDLQTTGSILTAIDTFFYKYPKDIDVKKLTINDEDDSDEE